MASDPRYEYPIAAASKVIIRKDDKVLLTREPMDNSWMPGRLGLPGGKYFLNEGISEGTRQKITNEAGVKCRMLGLFKVVQILMPEKTVYHFVFVAEYEGEDKEAGDLFTGGLEWVPVDELAKYKRDDLTEYYYPDLFAEYAKNPEGFKNMDLIKEQRSFSDPDIQNWMREGNKEAK